MATSEQLTQAKAVLAKLGDQPGSIPKHIRETCKKVVTEGEGDPLKGMTGHDVASWFDRIVTQNCAIPNEPKRAPQPPQATATKPKGKKSNANK